MIDRVVGLLYLGTSRSRHDANLFKKVCVSLNPIGAPPPKQLRGRNILGI